MVRYKFKCITSQNIGSKIVMNVSIKLNITSHYFILLHIASYDFTLLHLAPIGTIFLVAVNSNISEFKLIRVTVQKLNSVNSVFQMA